MKLNYSVKYYFKVGFAEGRPLYIYNYIQQSFILNFEYLSKYKQNNINFYKFKFSESKEILYKFLASRINENSGKLTIKYNGGLVINNSLYWFWRYVAYTRFSFNFQ